MSKVSDAINWADLQHVMPLSDVSAVIHFHYPCVILVVISDCSYILLYEPIFILLSCFKS